MKKTSRLITLILLLAFTVLALNAATHTVKKGDTLSGIAKKYGLTLSQLKEMNNLSSNTIKIGQVLQVDEEYEEEFYEGEDDSYPEEGDWYEYRVRELKEAFGEWYGNPELVSLSQEELDDFVSDSVADEDLSPEHVCAWLNRKLEDNDPAGEASIQEQIIYLDPETFDQAIELATRAKLGFIKDTMMKYKAQMLAHHEESLRLEKQYEKERLAAEEKKLAEHRKASKLVYDKVGGFYKSDRHPMDYVVINEDGTFRAVIFQFSLDDEIRGTYELELNSPQGMVLTTKTSWGKGEIGVTYGGLMSIKIGGFLYNFYK